MAKVLVIYDSNSSDTKKMAHFVAEGAAKSGAQVLVKGIDETDASEMVESDGIILGSPTYYGTMASAIKKLLDDSIRYHGRLAGKVGGAFSASSNGGGAETTVLDILKAFLVHGMIVQGSVRGDHYGPVSMGLPNGRAAGECVHLGQIVAELAGRLKTVRDQG